MSYPAAVSHTFTPSTTAQSSQVNANFEEIRSLLNGNLANAHVSASAAIAYSKLALTTLGDLFYGGASGTGSRLAGNTTTTRKFLRQTGDGAASAAPAWDTLVAGDMPATVAKTDNGNSWSTAQLPNATGTIDLGSATYAFRDLFLKGDSSNYHRITGTTPTGARVLTLPDSNSTTVIGAASATSNQFVTHITTAGVQTTAAIASGDLPNHSTDLLTSGTLPIARGGTNNGSLGVSALGIYVGDGSKLTQVTGTALQQFRVNAGGTAIEAFTPATASDIAIGTCEFRLSLTSGTAVTTSDVTAATTVYLTPYNGNRIALYDGSSAWEIMSSAEVSASLSGLTADLPYDVFAYDNSGTLTLELVAWTNSTTRATAIAYQNGVPVKTGATNKRLVGTILITSSTGQCEDSLKFRGVSNVYNRQPRPFKALDTTNSWSYSSAAWRSFNNSTTLGVGKIRYVSTLTDTLLAVWVNGYASSGHGIGIGIDSTSTNSAFFGGTNGATVGSGPAMYFGCPAVGLHDVYPLEYANGSLTFYGDNNTAYAQSGMAGYILM